MVKQTAEQFLEEREWECKWGQGGLPLLFLKEFQKQRVLL